MLPAQDSSTLQMKHALGCAENTDMYRGHTGKSPVKMSSKSFAMYSVLADGLLMTVSDTEVQNRTGALTSKSEPSHAVVQLGPGCRRERLALRLHVGLIQERGRRSHNSHGQAKKVVFTGSRPGCTYYYLPESRKQGLDTVSCSPAASSLRAHLPPDVIPAVLRLEASEFISGDSEVRRRSYSPTDRSRTVAEQDQVECRRLSTPNLPVIAPRLSHLCCKPAVKEIRGRRMHKVRPITIGTRDSNASTPYQTTPNESGTTGGVPDSEAAESGMRSQNGKVWRF
ncbi:hypothetical protein C8T65DRAFT_733309 [Cerioporus squamosus]|nr:hypothetical protein C8T65DRAFT_733309 [Cerioporus squamosus]